MCAEGALSKGEKKSHSTGKVVQCRSIILHLICLLEMAETSGGKEAFFFPFEKKEKFISPDMWIRMTKQKELKIVVKAGRSTSESR